MATPGKISITRGITYAFAALLLLYGIQMAFHFQAVGSMKSLTRTIYNHPLVVSNAAQQANTNIVKIHRSMKDIVLFTDPDITAAAIAEVDRLEQETFTQLQLVEKNILGEQGRRIADEAMLLFRQWAPIRQSVITSVRKGLRPQAALITRGQGAEHVEKLEAKMVELNSYARQKATGFLKTAEKVDTDIHRWSIVLFLSWLVLSALVILFSVKRTRLLEGEINEQHEKLKVTIHSIGDGVIVADTAGLVTIMNPVAEELTGWREEDGVGRDIQSVFNIIDETTRIPCENVVENVIAADGIVGLANHTLLVAKDGTERAIADSGAPIRDEHQVITGVVLVFRDQTRERQARLKRRHLEKQLQQAQKMESVGRLAGGVAHDFNNMLSVILGFTQLAQEQVRAEDPLHEDLNEIENAAQRAADITRQLLAFARKQTVSPKLLDVNETIEGLLKMLSRLIGEDIDLAWVPGEDLWTVKIDPGQIDQIIANLCVNARDAIEGVGKITIETGNVRFDEEYCQDHAGFQPGEYIMIGISDTGRGMDSATMANIFDPFFTTKAVGEGTGLGLAMVYGIVKQNKGFINVYSEEGDGTVIKVYLPSFAKTTITVQEQDRNMITHGSGETVLLVEDEIPILKLGERMLEVLGYKVLKAETPEKAIELAEEFTGEIHLLITDVVMPGMNGRELAGKIQSLHDNIKVLYMSGYTANVIAHRGVLDEGLQFMPKPFSKSVLARKVRAAMEA